jgi:hypothetical protein
MFEARACDVWFAQDQWQRAASRARSFDMKRRSTVLQALRAEARASLHALLLLLLIPVFHPVAEARAVENGTASVICSTFGDADADPLALADDLPDCLACAIAATAAPAAAEAVPHPEARLSHVSHPLPETSAPVSASANLPPSRGPPSLV